MFRFLVALLVSLASVTIARMRRGPLLPSWSFGFEVVTRAQKRFHSRVARLPPVEQRRAWGALRAQSPTRKKVRERRELVGGVPVLWFEPPGVQDDAPIVLYLHGGSFIYGSEASHGELCARLCLASGGRIAFVEYRLAPEHPFPAALDDACAAYRALLELGVPASRLFVAGDSAGGNLTLAMLLRLRDERAPLPRAAIPISPWVDVNERGGSMIGNEPYDWGSAWMFDVWRATYLPDGVSPQDPRVSPLFGDFAGLPPLLVVVGGAELLFDQVNELVERARAAGVEVRLHVGKDMIHDWMVHAPLFADCQRVIDEMGTFVRDSLQSGRAPE